VTTLKELRECGSTCCREEIVLGGPGTAVMERKKVYGTNL
jgi:hypothetical protein